MYKPREFRFHSVSVTEGIRLKTYSISAKPGVEVEMSGAMAHAAEALRQSSIPWMQHQGLGYLIYHMGEEGGWLLTRVWLKGGIVSGLLHRDQGYGFEPVPVPLVECVWESVVTQHERDAWVRQMMSDGADHQGYLEDWLPDGQY